MNKSKYKKLVGEHALNETHSIKLIFNFPKKKNVLLKVMINSNTAKIIPAIFSTLVSFIFQKNYNGFTGIQISTINLCSGLSL